MYFTEEVPTEADNATEVETTDNKTEAEKPLSEILEKVLGDDPYVSKALKLDIHSKLSSRLNYVIINGMKKDEIENILKKYEVPETFAAPILNEQIQAKLNEKAIKRDGYRMDSQKLASTALTTLAAAITMLNLADENGIDQENFSSKLSEAAKLIAEISFQQSETRKAYIVPRFAKPFQEVLKKSKPDKFLFGKDLSTMIKDIKDTDRLFKDLTAEKNVKPTTKSLGNSKRPLAKKNPANRRAGTGQQGQAKPRYFLKKDQRGPRYNQPQSQQFQYQQYPYQPNKNPQENT